MPDVVLTALKNPWWGVVGIAFAAGIAWHTVSAEAAEARTTAEAASTALASQLQMTQGLARYACRQNRADAMLAGLRCDQLLGDPR